MDLRLQWPTENPQTPTTFEDRWKDCVFHAQKIVDVYRAWPTEYCEKLDPLMLPMTWNAVCLLILHTMNKDYTDLKDSLTVWDSVDFLMDFFHKSSRYWTIASILMSKSIDSIKA